MPIGKGLQSLIPRKEIKQKVTSSGQTKPVDSRLSFTIEISKIKRNPHQPRKVFDKASLEELANSIKEHGILQPLIVSKLGEDYQLIAGERRLEAAKIAGLFQVPVIVRDSSEQENLELALVENLQRDNLNPMERAYAFKKLIDEFNFTQEKIAKTIGKSRESVANTLRLLNLPAEIQRGILENKISEGHGRVILSLADTEKQILLFKEILKNDLSVREVEARVEKIAKSLSKKTKIKTRKDLYLLELEDKLSNVLGTRVKLTRKGKKGKIIIEFFSQEELEGVLDKILRGLPY